MQSSENGALVTRQKYSVLIDNRARPILEITLSPFSKNGKPMNLLCLLDTGTDFNILPKTIADSLGHKMIDGVGKPRKISGVDGGADGFLHTNEIKFCGESFLCDFIVCEDWRNESIGLLGHYGAIISGRGFFSEYVVTFNTPKQYFEIFKPAAAKPEL